MTADIPKKHASSLTEKKQLLAYTNTTRHAKNLK